MFPRHSQPYAVFVFCACLGVFMVMRQLFLGELDHQTPRSKVPEKTIPPMCLCGSQQDSPDPCPSTTLLSNKTCQEDRCLIDLIKSNIIPPSKEMYNFHGYAINGEHDQVRKLNAIIGEKRDGFFIECGALTGEKESNSLFFELKRNWTGLLIEANPNNFVQIAPVHRKSWSLQACISPTGCPFRASFWNNDVFGHVVDNAKQKVRYQDKDISMDPDQVGLVPCYPFYSIYSAIGKPTIDLFSLDVEGDELNILKTIPWDRVDIKLLIVEWGPLQTETKALLREYMATVGYHAWEVPDAWDFVFTKTPIDGDMVKKRMSESNDFR